MFSPPAKNSCVLFVLKTRFRLRYFVSYCLWKPFFDSIFFFNSVSLTPSNLISLKFLVTLRLFTLFYPKIRAIKWQKSPKICFAWLVTAFPIFSMRLISNIKRTSSCFRTFFRKKKTSLNLTIFKN